MYNKLKFLKTTEIVISPRFIIRTFYSMSWYVASSDNLHRPFELKADEVIGVGRDPTTGIKDTNVSK